MKKFLAMILLVAILAASFTVAFAGGKKGEFWKIKSANVYKKTSRSSDTGIVIKNGSIVELAGNEGKLWVKIKYNYDGDTGYIHASKLGKLMKKASEADIKYANKGKNNGNSKGSAGSEEDSKVKKVKTTGKVTMRKEGSLAGKYVKIVKKGTYLKVKKQAEDDRGVIWYKVTYKGDTGWISSTYTKKAE